MVYMVGGAVDVPGNVGTSHAGIDNSVAEAHASERERRPRSRGCGR
jgi:hypothetical protein